MLGQNEGCGLAVLDKCYRGFPLNGSTPDILVEVYNLELSNMKETKKPAILYISQSVSFSFKTVGEIPSVEECQWFCKELYSGECTWFGFDTNMNQCYIFKGSITDYTSSCELVGYPKNLTLRIVVQH